MKRLNEYSPAELGNLQLLLSLVGDLNLNDGHTEIKSLDIYKFWASEVNEAVRDQEIQNTQIKLPYPELWPINN